MNDVFTKPDAWAAEYIELLLYFGNDASDSNLAGILEAAWGWSSLDGPYLENNVEPEAQELQSISSLDNFETSGLYGVATLPNSCKAAFVTYVIIDDDGLFVSLELPFGSLGEAYPVHEFPFEGAATDAWDLEVSTWLSELGQYIFERFPFTRAVIGFEITAHEYVELVNFALPLRRCHGYLVPEDGKLRYYAQNVSDPLLLPNHLFPNRF